MVPDPYVSGMPAAQAALAGGAGKMVAALQTMMGYMLAPAESSALIAELGALAVQSASNISALARRASMANDLIAWASAESYAPQQVDLVPFPITGYQANGFFDIAQSVLAFFLTVCLLFPVSRLIRGLVAEKETKIREGMKMMVRALIETGRQSCSGALAWRDGSIFTLHL